MQLHPDVTITEADRIAFHDDLLGETLDVAHELLASLRSLHADVMASDATPEAKFAVVAQMVETLDVNARTIRRTVILREHRATARRAAADRRAADRRQVVRRVQDAISRERPESVETLDADLAEIMDTPEFDADLAATPLADLVRDVQSDIGVGAGVSCTRQRTAADLARLHALAARLPGPRDPHGRRPAPD